MGQRLSVEQEHHYSIHDEDSSPILPEKELPTIPYLGFGSKSTTNHSSNHQPSATTCLTWSKSAADPGTQPKRSPRFENMLEVD
jgi:hypothetical protein